MKRSRRQRFLHEVLAMKLDHIGQMLMLYKIVRGWSLEEWQGDVEVFYRPQNYRSLTVGSTTPFLLTEIRQKHFRCRLPKIFLATLPSQDEAEDVKIA